MSNFTFTFKLPKIVVVDIEAATKVLHETLVALTFPLNDDRLVIKLTSRLVIDNLDGIDCVNKN